MGGSPLPQNLGRTHLGEVSQEKFPPGEGGTPRGETLRGKKGVLKSGGHTHGGRALREATREGVG